MPPRKKNFNFLTYFDESDNNFKCKTCARYLKKDRVFNLKKHLKLHDIQIEEKEDTENIMHQIGEGEQEDSDTIKAKLLSKEYEFHKKRGRSKIWNTVGVVVNAHGDRLKNIVACRNCLSVMKYSSCTSNLVKHKCCVKANYTTVSPVEDSKPIVESDSIERQIFEAATEWTVQNCRPFNIIQDSGLKKLFALFATVGAQYGNFVNTDNFIPHSSTLSQTLSELYEMESQNIMEEIAEAKGTGYAISSDVWTDIHLKESYVSCILHYIKEGEMINRLLAIEYMEDDSSTGTNIKKQICKILDTFDCDMVEDRATVITNRSSNMISAFQNNSHIHCVNHLLDAVVEKAFEEKTELSELLRNCNKLNKYLKNSGINSQLNVPLESETRWNTIYYTISSIGNNWDTIRSILHEKNEIHRINNFDVHNIRAMATILQHIESATKQLEAVDCPTLHLVIPHIFNLKKKTTTYFNDTTLVVELKSSISRLLEVIVDPCISDYHKIAFFLFPPTNKLLQFSAEEKENVIKQCKELMKIYWTEKDDVEETKEKSIKLEIFSGLVPSFSDNINDAIESEIQAYMSLKILVTEEFRVLQWWDTNREHFPLLYQVSCQILGIPATIACSERAFSKARLLISENRNNHATNSNMLNEIMFLNLNT